MRFIKKPWVIPILLTILVFAVGGFLISTILSNENVVSEKTIQSQLQNMYGGTIDKLTKNGDIYEAIMKKNGAAYTAEIDAITGNVLSLTQTSEAKPEKPQVLTEEEMRNILEEKYLGKVERIALKTKDNAPIFDVEIAENGSLTTVIADAVTGETISKTEKETETEKETDKGTDKEKEKEKETETEKDKETTIVNAMITKEQAISIAHERLKGEVDDVTFEKTNDGGYYLIEIDGEDEEATFQIHAISGKILSVTYDD